MAPRTPVVPPQDPYLASIHGIPQLAIVSQIYVVGAGRPGLGYFPMPANVATFFSDLLSFAVSARTLDSGDSSGYSSNHPTCVNRGVLRHLPMYPDATGVSRRGREFEFCTGMSVPRVLTYVRSRRVVEAGLGCTREPPPRGNTQGVR